MGNGTTLPSLDVDKAIAKIDEIKKGVGDISIRMSANLCKTQEEYERGAFLLKEANLAAKKIKAEADIIMAPAKNYVDRVTSNLKAIIAPIESAIKALKERGNEFIHSEEQRKQKELDRLRGEKFKNEVKMETADTSKEQVKAIRKDAEIAQKIEIAQTHVVGNTARRRVFTIADVALVPREYLLVDESKIRKVQGNVGSPFPTIPGVVFEDIASMRG